MIKRSIFRLIFSLCLLLAGCRKDNVPEWAPVVGVNGEMTGKIRGIPAGVVFDRISVEISGFDWQTIATVEAPLQNDTVMLILPAAFAAADLQRVDRGTGGKNMEGYWPSTASDPEALVASLRDEFIAWNGDRRVGRVYLTDWPGEGANVGKMYIGFQFADRPFTLGGFTGNTGSFSFADCAFEQGWNAYAKVNDSEKSIRVTTKIPESAKLAWRFEARP